MTEDDDSEILFVLDGDEGEYRGFNEDDDGEIPLVLEPKGNDACGKDSSVSLDESGKAY